MSKRALWLSLFFSFVSLTPACGDSKDSKKDKEEETGKADTDNRVVVLPGPVHLNKKRNDPSQGHH